MSLMPADRQVPDLVLKAIQHLDHNGVKVEGLFRVSGAKSRITEVCVFVCVSFHVSFKWCGRPVKQPAFLFGGHVSGM